MNEVVTRAALWPTATATDGRDSRRATTPNKGGPNSHPGTTLLDAALLEAHAADGEDPAEWRARHELHAGKGDDATRSGLPLGIAAQEASEATGQLSPAWVELLMGYPIGWTDPARTEPCGEHQGWPAPQGAPQFDYEPARLAGPDDAENRRARITALGNAVVRQCVTVAGARMLAIGAELEALERALA